jgi:hypothetical protein
MRNNFYLFLVFAYFFSWNLEAMQSLHEKYPNMLLTEDYGILSEGDMHESSRKIPPAYNPETSTHFLLWQCFPIKDVDSKYREWKDSNPLGVADVIVTMCDFELWMKKVEPIQSYGSRRAKEVTYCREFKKSWNKLTKNETDICLYGEGSVYETEIVDGKPKKVKSWVWNKIKTKKGCYSYFGEKCD